MSIILETHIVPEGIDKTRLSDYACGIFEALPSRKSVKKAILRGEFLVNGKAVGTGHWVLPEQEITLLDLELKERRIFELRLEVVHEEEHFAVINKPAGLVVSGNQFRTTENALLYNLQVAKTPDALRYPRPVHRLDAATSGLLLIAKTRTALVNLGQQFENKTIQKCYQAVVAGETPEEGIIDFLIENQTATSRFELVKKVPSLRNGFLSLLNLYPETGRTHQLRIHCAKSGFPIMGDKLYGEEGAILFKKGLFLSAVELKFKHPDNQQLIKIEKPAPAKFQSLLEREAKRFEKYN